MAASITCWASSSRRTTESDTPGGTFWRRRRKQPERRAHGYQIFRLSADFDISGYAPATQVVLRALQQHGAVVYDSMGPGIDGAGLLAMSNGWSGTDYVTARTQLNSVPMSAFEAVDVSESPWTRWSAGRSSRSQSEGRSLKVAV